MKRPAVFGHAWFVAVEALTAHKWLDVPFFRAMWQYCNLQDAIHVQVSRQCVSKPK
jgi:hypothetical protein